MNFSLLVPTLFLSFQIAWELMLDKSSFRVIPVRRDRRHRFEDASSENKGKTSATPSTPAKSSSPAQDATTPVSKSSDVKDAAPKQPETPSESKSVSTDSKTMQLPAAATSKQDKSDTLSETEEHQSEAGDKDDILGSYSMDERVLRREIIQDLAEGRTPCAVLASVGLGVRLLDKSNLHSSYISSLTCVFFSFSVCIHFTALS
jgi:hypothetical protein